MTMLCGDLSFYIQIIKIQVKKTEQEFYLMKGTQFLRGQLLHWLTISYNVYYYIEDDNIVNLLCLLITCLLSLALFVLHYTDLQTKALGTIFCIQIDMVCLIVLNAKNLNQTTYAQLILCYQMSKDLIKSIKTQSTQLISPLTLYYAIFTVVVVFQQIYSHTAFKFSADSPQLIICLFISFIRNISVKLKSSSQLITTTQLETGGINNLNDLIKVHSQISIDSALISGQYKDPPNKGIEQFDYIKQHYISSETIFSSLEYLQEGLIVLDMNDQNQIKIQYMNNATRVLFGKESEVDVQSILEGLNSIHVQNQDIIEEPNSRRESVQQRLANLQYSKLCKSLFLQQKDMLFCSVKQPLMEQINEKFSSSSMKELLEKLIRARRSEVVTVNTHLPANSINLNTNKNITISQSQAGYQSRHDAQFDRLMEFTITLTKDKNVLMICRDVTHRQKIRYLKEYDIQKSKTLSFVSHEYRQPLGCIIQMIECVLQQQVIQKNHEIAENLQAALDNSKYMLNLSNDLLDLAQIKNGKFKIQQDTFNLEVLINDCIKMFALKAKIKDLQIINDYQKDAPKLIISDKNRIKQIIVNLLSNAFKFTCSKIEVIIQKQNTTKLRIGVRDDGIGISLDDQQKLFKAFSKINSEESKKLNEQGVGLGLLISNQIAQSIGCQTGLNIESNNDQQHHFSFFYFEIQIEVPIKTKISIFKIPEIEPLYQEVEEITTFNQEQQKNTLDVINSCNHFLIVDDDCFNGFAFTKILSGLQKNNSLSMQFDVESVLSGKESIEKVKNKRCCNSCQGYKLIFMDVEMPIMNGIQTVKEIIKIIPTQIVIGCSGYSDQQERRQCLDAGMTDYLTKPINESDLLQILKKYQ